MKIGIAGLRHETVTFWPGFTDLDEFERVAFHGEQVIEARRGTNTAIGGFIDVCEKAGVELFPVCEVPGGATATVRDRVYDFYVSEMKREFAKVANELDGILLALHGAMVTESLQDAETHIIREIRQVIGYEKPIMVTLDLHGNLDPLILKEATAVFGYQSSPHVDMGETGRRAARTLLATLSGEIKPTTAIVKPGLVVPSVFSATTVSPAKDIIARLREWEQYPGVVDASVFFGFAWSDVHQLGMSAVAVTDDDPELAERVANDLAQLAWENRRALTRGENLYSVKEGVELAIKKAKKASKPIIILDHADRTGDTTFVLRELLAQGAQNAAAPCFVDPKAVEVCKKAGVGSGVELEIGGSTGWRDGGPLRVSGKVLWVGEGRYICSGPMWKGLEIDLGPTAIIKADGVWIQLITFKHSLINEDPFTKFGYKASDFDIIVTKSKTHFRAVYEKVGEEIIIVDAPGQCPADLSVFNYKNVPPGVYPITRK
ncbi:MAG: microcystin degradation protein MlrC [Thermoproteota archaeon]|nr:MAG: microcystin degradation protein MlrC [Candidatus Korarchaeota archaeon]